MKTGKQLNYRMSSEHSLLVEIYLWEKDIDSALKEARSGNYPEHLWLKLASACESTHPQDAIEIYQKQVVRSIQLTNNSAYDQVTNLLKRIKKLMTGLKQQKAFRDYLKELRVQYRQERNFIKRIEPL